MPPGDQIASEENANGSGAMRPGRIAPNPQIKPAPQNRPGNAERSDRAPPG